MKQTKKKINCITFRVSRALAPPTPAPTVRQQQQKNSATYSPLIIVPLFLLPAGNVLAAVAAAPM